METQAWQVSGATHFVCLLGNPTGHSLSPAMHNLSFRLLGIDAVYTCFDVDNADLGAIVSAFKALRNWDGFNLTMPCKKAVIPHLDELDDASALIGAVNTVKKGADGRALGFNTDGKGFMANLAAHGVEVRGKRMALLGPGGAGSAILAQAALDGVGHIDVFGRSEGASYAAAGALAERVAAKTGCAVSLHDFGNAEELAEAVRQADILVNTTPVGMGEGRADTPVDPSLLHSGLVVADAIYHPRETRLIEDARSRGCVAVPGLGMLIYQAAIGEEIWYGARMPVAEIERQVF